MKFPLQAFLILLTILFTKDAISQNELVFDESGYQSVMAKAKKQHKPVFYMVYATWCPHCKKMKDEVFTDPAVKDFLEKNFICASQDVDKGEGQALKNTFDIKSMPTFVFLDENETVLYQVSGELKPADLIKESNDALNPQKQLPFLKTQFYNDPSNSDKCLAYLMTLRKGRDRKSISAPADVYLKTQTEPQLVSAVNWRIIANAVTDIQSREFQYVLKNQSEFAKIASPDRVKRKIMSVVSELLNPHVQAADTVNYAKDREIAKTVKLHSTDSLIFTFDTSIAERTQNWGAYKKATKESVEKYIWNDQKAIKDIGQVYLKNVTDLPSLQYAVKWAKRALEIQNTYDGNLLLARLYIKVNDKKQAIAFARKAKEITTAYGWNSKEADELFTELNIK